MHRKTNKAKHKHTKTKALGRFTVLHKTKLGKRYVAPQTVKKQIRKKRSATGSTRRKLTAHDMFLRRRNGERMARAKSERLPHWQHLKTVHQEWRDMLPAAKAHFDLEAEADNEHRPPELNLEEIDEGKQVDASPWGLGSVSYPLSIERLQDFATELLPDCKKWMREAYDASRAIEDPGRIGGTIVADVEVPSVDSLSRWCRRNRPCYEVTPGICQSDVLYAEVKHLHAKVRTALALFGCDKKR